MMRRPTSKSRLLPLLAVVAIAGCVSSDMSDLEMYVQEVKARKPVGIDPLPEIKQVETFVYMAADRRNPFEPEQPQKDEPGDGPVVGNGIAPDPFRRKEELEAFPLDSIRMVGILKHQNNMWGLVQTKDGIIHRVKVGNYMGENHGQIMRITEERIDLTEIVADIKGGYRERRASLAIGGKE